MRPAGAAGWRSLVALLLQTLALALALGLWWGERHNTLFHNGRWVVGKNTGKFVFYTTKFLFRPLSGGKVDLTSDMGFQEILYREGEGERRRLESLSFECRISADAYLWVKARKDGPRAFAVRISRKEGFPSGFHRFGEAGDLESHAPLLAAPPWEGRGKWNRVELRLDGGEWRLQMNGKDLGSAPADGPPQGAFGFQGSGNPDAPVLLRGIVLRFVDPVSGRGWTERERFTPAGGVRRSLPAALAFSLALLLLRRWRRRVVGGLLQPPDRDRLFRADEVGVSAAAALAAAAAALQPGAVALVPGALLAAEIVFVVALALGSRGEAPAVWSPRGRRGLVLFAVVLSLIGAAAIGRHGDMVGRGGRGSSWWSMRNVHPDAYPLRPAQQRSSSAHASPQTIRVAPNVPHFPEGGVWRAQRITLEFVPSSESTLDVVFQQLSYLTPGDLRGEELPLQRRLVRLSAREDVPMGLATGTHRQPSPFLKISGRPRAGQANRLVIDSGDEGVGVELNGERSFFPGVAPLGHGETGLLAYGAPVAVSGLRIEPLPGERARERLRWLAGLALPSAAVAAVWALLRCAGAVAPGTVAALVLGGLFAPAVYLAGTLALDRSTLLLLARDRLAWLELSLVAAACTLPALVLFVRRQVRGAIGFFYLACGVLTAAVGLLVFDSLAAARPELLRRFAGDDAVAPGELAPEDGGGPWYTRNRVIGGNSYVWRQRFGTKQAGPKPAGTVRVFLMGGSQAWGSGAADSFATFDQLVERRLRAKGVPVEIFNAGVNGAGIRVVRAFYEGVIAALEPDVLVLDIGLNDSAGIAASRAEEARRSQREAGAREFASLLDLCAAAGVSVLLVQEPMCEETPLVPDAEYYAALERLARQRGVGVLKPQETLRQAGRSATVWWDTAHLAPFGHELLSRLLEPALADAVRARTAAPRGR